VGVRQVFIEHDVYDAARDAVVEVTVAAAVREFV
jgi:hypothetical protein